MCIFDFRSQERTRVLSKVGEYIGSYVATCALQCVHCTGIQTGKRMNLFLIKTHLHWILVYLFRSLHCRAQEGPRRELLWT